MKSSIHFLRTRKLNQDYNFPPKEGTGIRTLLPHVTQDCISFLLSMLAYDPDDRITSREALRHVFFKDVQLSSPTIENLEKNSMSTSKEKLVVQDKIKAVDVFYLYITFINIEYNSTTRITRKE